MSGHGGGHGGAGRDLRIALGLLILLFFVWFFTGGPNNGRTTDPTINPSEVINSPAN